ncbi:MAG TPA: hypothetical protein VFA91_03730 [Candidatus Polarisedimenticolia bacterium]|nr:hypothetical protein [Candidatus Polarisedimenticolia bacterium]
MLQRALDIFRGKAITIPPMDGALRPNTALDEAPVLLQADAPDNLAWIDDRLVFSSANKVLAIDMAAGNMAPETLVEFPVPVACLAGRPGGGSAVGLDSGEIRIWDAEGAETVLAGIGPRSLKCPTALLFLDSDTLIICQGSGAVAPSGWARDLMDHGSSGSLWRIELKAGQQTCLASSLAFPQGVAARGAELVVAESWKYRLIALSAERPSRPRVILPNLPAYPSRLSPAGDGGAWLCLFAPRNRLIEFVLQEAVYRRAMLQDVAPEFWIAPALASHRSFLEPLQCGGVTTMGISKAWAPSRSYGLLVRLDREMQPIASYHSRANGTRHGVTSAIEAGAHIYAAARGGDAILDLAKSGD